MRPFSLLTALALAAQLSPPTAFAQVTVPDDHLTIVAALASGAPVIHVRSGTYVENLTIDRDVFLAARPAATPFEEEANPVLVGDVVFQTPAASAEATFQGFDVTGNMLIQVSSVPTMVINIRENRINGDISQSTSVAGFFRVRGNTIVGSAQLNSFNVDFTNNTIVGGGLTVNYEGQGTVRANYVVNSSGTAIDVFANDPNPVILRNTVDVAVVGLLIRDASGANVEDNLVSNTSSHGYQAISGGFGGTGTFDGNTALDCLGDGFFLAGVGYTLTNNRAERSGGDGFDIDAIVNPFSNNVSLESGGDGVAIANALQADFNVIGRSGARGFVADDATTIEFNTSYLNAQNGFVLGGTSSVNNNIAHGNLGYGLVFTSGSATLACNDWFGNTTGATSGVSPGGTDLFVNPLFCNLAGDDITLSAASPLVGTACGQIGAEGVGCPSTTSVIPGTMEAALRVFPQPARGIVRFAGGSLAQGGMLRIYDVRGALCSEIMLEGGRDAVAWDLRGMDGRRVPAGVYFVQANLGDRTLHQRVVIAR